MELSFLRPLYERQGPYVSVYADTTRTAEEDPKAPELRWRALREELAVRGTPPRTLAVVEAAVLGELDRHWPGGLAVFAADGEVVLTERLAAAPPAPLARVAALPHVLPLLALRGERIPYLVAVVDRTGADISGVSVEGSRIEFDVSGDADHRIRKVAASDWNQSRAQRAAEETWRANAKKVGHEVEQATRRFAPEVVVIAGDIRARTAVMDELPSAVLERTAEAGAAARAKNGDHQALDAEITRLVELKSVEHRLAAAARFEAERANRRRAADGIGPAVAALRRAQVDVLMLEDRPDSAARLWVGPEPTHLATAAGELRALGVDDVAEERADTALIRALTATSGELLVVPDGGLRAESGVGAVLRYVDASTHDGAAGPGRSGVARRGAGS
jgi:release factor family 2